MKRVISAAALVMFGGATLVACGSNAPTDASEEDFCEVATSLGDPESDYFNDDLSKFNAEDFGNDLEEVGTPEGISDDEREGFEVVVKEFKDLGNDVDTSDVQDVEVSEDDDARADDFLAYISTTCS